MTDAAAPPLNPFATPSGTAVRFVLLVVAASTAAENLLSQDTGQLLGLSASDVLTYQHCMIVRTREAVALRHSNVGGSPDIREITESLPACHDPRDVFGPWPTISALLLFWLIVFVVYWCLPAWRIRRKRLRRTGPALLPEMAAYLSRLQEQTGVRESVTFLLDPLDPRVNGLAFGRVGRRYVVISGGLAALFSQDRHAFRTVLLHELAHLRNHDVDITFLTVTVWRLVAFLLLRRAVYLLLAILVGRFSADRVLPDTASTLQTAVLTALVPLACNAVLRSRELYADARTKLWDTGPSNMQHLFDVYSAHPAPGGGNRRLLRKHPSLGERRTALTDTFNFFRLGFWESVSLGATAAILFNNISDLMAHPVDSPGARIGDHVAIAVAGPLFTAGLTLSVWRVADRCRTSGTAMNLGPVAAGVGLGLCLRPVTSPSTALLVHEFRSSPAATLLLWSGLALLCGVIVVCWIGLVTRAWAPVAAARDRPALLISAVIAAASLPMTFWVFYTLRQADVALYAQANAGPRAGALRSFLAAAGTMLFGESPWVVITVVLLLAVVPLAGHAWARRCGRGPGGRSMPPEHAVALRTGVVCGAAGVWSGYLLLVLAGEKVQIMDVEAITVVAELTAAVVTSARTKDLRFPHGVVAAFVAGAIVPLGTLTGLRVLTGGTWYWDVPSRSPLPTPLEWWSAVAIPTWGLLVATAAAALTAGLAEWIRRQQRTSAKAGTTPNEGTG
ncbi:M56 family metallopeptidase [Streptomyces sp. NPDC059785]|uniref:M56 family metallopeptidase n=1 Tax=Streptomyces sp. NPDC059785 TaxID=3346945 RepID=UPI00365687B7